MKDELEAELNDEVDVHIWDDVKCPTCGSGPHTHCVGDPDERPDFQYEDRDDASAQMYLKYRYNKPCAKRVIKAVLEKLEE